MTTKIEYAIMAAGTFINNLHREGFDRCMIATFGNSYCVEQEFISTAYDLHSTLYHIGTQVLEGEDEGTRLFDSIDDMISDLRDHRRQDCPCLLIIVTDGEDNYATHYKDHQRFFKSPKHNAVSIGKYIAEHYNNEPSNYIFVIGVGRDDQIDKIALSEMAYHGKYPSITIESFHFLESTFLQIALHVSAQIIGTKVDYQKLSWERVTQILHMSQTPIDYAFLIDRSGSMSLTVNRNSR